MADLTIFDVEHGSCALLTANNGATMMVDCGKNSSSGWSPTVELTNRNITTLDRLAITNFDEDHANGLPELRASHVRIRSLLRAKNIEPDEIEGMKSEDGMGAGIKELVKMAKEYCHPAAAYDYGDIDFKIFYNPSGSFQDENNMSAVIIVTAGAHKVVFPGDVERAGFELLMKRSAFVEAIRDSSILIAPHHGRESSVHEAFISTVNPFWTIISDCGYKYDTQLTVPTYKRLSRGASFRGRDRWVLTTRNDGEIALSL